MRIREEQDGDVDVPMTPLIDVVFLLLIFFLVATNFTQSEVDQKIQLPRAEGGAERDALPVNLMVNIRTDGTTIVQGRVLDDEALRTLVGEWHAQHPQGSVIIRGDTDAAHGAVMRLVGLCNAAGVSNFAFAQEASGGGGS